MFHDAYQMLVAKMCKSGLKWIVSFAQAQLVIDVSGVHHARPVATGRIWRQGPQNFVFTPDFVVPRKSCFSHVIKTKILPHKPSNLATGLHHARRVRYFVCRDGLDSGQTKINSAKF